MCHLEQAGSQNRICNDNLKQSITSKNDMDVRVTVCSAQLASGSRLTRKLFCQSAYIVYVSVDHHQNIFQW